MTETWRSIKGFEGFYEVSNMGNIRGLDRWINHPIPPAGGYWWKGRVMKQKISRVFRTGRNTLSVSLRRDSKKQKKYMTGRLVYETFVGPIKDGYVICHKDDNYLNNDIRNLLALSLGDTMCVLYKTRNTGGNK